MCVHPSERRAVVCTAATLTDVNTVTGAVLGRLRIPRDVSALWPQVDTLRRSQIEGSDELKGRFGINRVRARAISRGHRNW